MSYFRKKRVRFPVVQDSWQTQSTFRPSFELSVYTWVLLLLFIPLLISPISSSFFPCLPPHPPPSSLPPASVAACRSCSPQPFLSSLIIIILWWRGRSPWYWSLWLSCSFVFHCSSLFEAHSPTHTAPSNSREIYQCLQFLFQVCEGDVGNFLVLY